MLPELQNTNRAPDYYRVGPHKDKLQLSSSNMVNSYELITLLFLALLIMGLRKDRLPQMLPSLSGS